VCLARCVSGITSVGLSAVAFVERGTLPKTASGKLQRGAARDGFLRGTLSTTHLWQARDASRLASNATPPPPRSAAQGH